MEIVSELGMRRNLKGRVVEVYLFLFLRYSGTLGALVLGVRGGG